MRKFALPLAYVGLIACVQTALNPTNVAAAVAIPTHPNGDIITTSIAGSLVRRDDCLLFYGSRTARYFLPIWPVGSRFDGNAVAVPTAHGGEKIIVAGRRFTLSGSTGDWTNIRDPDLKAFERRCSVTPFFVADVQ